MPAKTLRLADPPAEDLDSLEPVSRHSCEWRPRRIRNKRSKQPPRQSQPLEPVKTTSDSLHSDDLESRLGCLEGVVKDCALLLRNTVADRLDKIESSLSNESTRLDARINAEAKQSYRVLTDVTRKVSAAIDQIRHEARTA